MTCKLKCYNNLLIKTTSNNCHVPVEATLLDEDQLVWQTEAVVLTTYQKELAVFLTGGLQANHIGRKKNNTNEHSETNKTNSQQKHGFKNLSLKQIQKFMKHSCSVVCLDS